ncbi:MAG: DUF2298 domain-containing protein [Candidatus Dojkabacteria bacterium]|nr:MAG: DUF2298 domain-containing protein [Candidatus Dojkabacteria bacterium]
MIHLYFLGIEAFTILGYFLGSVLFPKRYSLLFYKFFGVTIFSLLVWYMSLLSGKGWTNFLWWSIAFLFLFGVTCMVIWHKRARLPTKQQLKTFIGIEILSYLLYLLLVYIRTFKPDILGTEKLMDVALINAIMKQNQVPIENPWLSGFFMNYYYFGHFILAVFQFIFKIPTAVGYNLAVSLGGVWIVQAAYLVVRKLQVSHIAAFVIALIVTFGGNLYLLAQVILHNNTEQWFASATRVIPFTINEFPSYSVILGDLHGHYLSYPFFLVGIFLLLDILFPKRETKRQDWIVPKSLFLGILLGHLYLTNSWDVLTLALFGCILVLFLLINVRFVQKKSMRSALLWMKKVILLVGLPVASMSIPQFLSSRSYYLPPVGGIGINTNFSGLWEMFLLFGQFLLLLLFAGVLYWWILRGYTRRGIIRYIFTEKQLLPVLLLITAFVLILSVEFVYAKDVFTTLNPPYARTNTVFKIYFHAWAFLSIGTLVLAGRAIGELFRNMSQKWLIAVPYAGLVAVVAVMMSYPFISVDQYINPVFRPFQIKRLVDANWSNGYAYMQSQYGPDYNLVSHLLVQPKSTILEIVTYDSYSYYARVASYSGHTAVSGWPLHNVQWYGGYDGSGISLQTKEQQPILIAERIIDIEQLYTEQEPQYVEQMLRKYGIDFVVFSAREASWAEEKGRVLNRAAYDELCTVSWEQDDAKLYDCRE